MTKRALLTGITGQDGSYLAELLLQKGYEVHGIIRRASSFNTARIDHLYQDQHEENVRLFLHYGDLTASSNLTRLIGEIQPDEIYNLGAQSHVQVSFELPEYTTDVDAVGTLRLLDAIRATGVRTAVALCGGQTIRLLDHPQLPGGLRAARQQRHPVQSRVAAPRRNFRHPQNYHGSRPDSPPVAGMLVHRQPGCRPRLGLRAGLRQDDVADAAAGGAG